MAATFNLECSQNNFETIYTNFIGLESDKNEEKTLRYETTSITWRPSSVTITKKDSLLGTFNYYHIKRDTLEFSGKSYGDEVKGKCRVFDNNPNNAI